MSKPTFPSLLASSFSLIVKANAPSTELLDYDTNLNAYRMNVSAPAKDGKANIEIVKFLSKLTKKKARILSGLTSKKKVVVLE